MVAKPTPDLLSAYLDHDSNRIQSGLCQKAADSQNLARLPGVGSGLCHALDHVHSSVSDRADPGDHLGDDRLGPNSSVDGEPKKRSRSITGWKKWESMGEGEESL